MLWHNNMSFSCLIYYAWCDILLRPCHIWCVSMLWSCLVEYITYVVIYSCVQGPSWSWSYCSWIYNYQCNQCLSPLTLWVRLPLRRNVLDTTLCDQVCQWLAACRWLSPGTPVSSTNKIDRHDITEILLKVALNTITITLIWRKPDESYSKTCRYIRR